MGVRFRPGRAYRFLPFPLSDVTDSMVPTGDVWGHKGTYLEEAVFEARNNMHRQQLVEEFLLQQLVTTTPRPRFEAAVKEIIRTRGQTRVHEVANGVGWSSRQLERDFRVSVGLSPKLFSRIMRFQNLLRLVGEGVLREWTSLALEGGYADQPHMVREFREFAGHTPAEQRIAASEFGSYLCLRGGSRPCSDPRDPAGRTDVVLVRTGSGSDPVSTGSYNPVATARGSDRDVAFIQDETQQSVLSCFRRIILCTHQEW